MTSLSSKLSASLRRNRPYWAVMLATILLVGVGVPTAEHRGVDFPSWFSVAAIGAGIGLASVVGARTAPRR